MTKNMNNIPKQTNEDDVHQRLQDIKSIIDKELRPYNQNAIVKSRGCYNLATVNVAFRTYYQLLHKYDIEDTHFHPYICAADNDVDERYFTILYFVLLTGQGLHLEPEAIKNRCLKAFANAVDTNQASVLEILKTLNLLFKKWPQLEVGDNIALDHVYFCLQSNQLGMRDEMLSLLQYVCLDLQRAQVYFIRIVHCWPWTYRTKLYMLVSILSKQSLEALLNISSFDKDDFFRGLRSTLNYKNLLASSQHVVKVLSAQSSKGLLQMCCEIICRGSMQEIRNLYAQWFSRIQQREELFEMVCERLCLQDILKNQTYKNVNWSEIHRVILICHMFSKEIHNSHAQNFYNLNEELLKLDFVFKLELETQLIVFKYIIDNMNHLAIQDCLKFIAQFARKHMTVENAQMRNAILGKFSVIINHIAKVFSKLSVEEEDLAKTNILKFFQDMQNDIETGIESHIYQPKIYCLKLLEILIASLYGKTVTKNAKNCSLTHNEKLAGFLKQHNVFNGSSISMQLFKLLNDPTRFDDALNIIVSLIAMIYTKDEAIVELAFNMAVQACCLSDIDESNLSCLYARVAVQNSIDEVLISKLFQETFDGVKCRLHAFEKDPLFACKSKGWHLFSSLNVLNEVIQGKPEVCCSNFSDILLMIEQIEDVIIRMLSVCNNQDADKVTAASFEEIDKSLELLVTSSQCSSENHESSRKYLLMSFWLTLKACCDLSASMGQFMVSINDGLEPSDSRVVFLQRCLYISVTVLTKCRHKGAIEAAGGSIGKLTRCITSQLSEQSQEYELLHRCLQELYEPNNQREISTTRRGAGFSIMFLHIVKSEEHRNRSILRRVIEKLLLRSKAEEEEEKLQNSSINCDHIEALHLHYLCVLVRDTELREAMSRYYNEIMMAAVSHIDNTEWTIRNAALQLLGALVPKIVGQKQATEFEALLWEPSEVTFCEVIRKLNMSYDYILGYCRGEKTSVGSIILFLEFLHKVEYIHKDESFAPKSVQEFRELMWLLLRHPCEKVRKLSSICFVRSHEFSHELPSALIQISGILFDIRNENFFEGLIQTLHNGILKFQYDSLNVVPQEQQQKILAEIRNTLERNFRFKHQYKLYTLCKLWDLLQLITSGGCSVIIDELRNLPLDDNDNTIARDLWFERIK